MQIYIPEKPFSAHDVNDVHNIRLCTIENANGRNDKLAILRAFDLGGH